MNEPLPRRFWLGLACANLLAIAVVQTAVSSSARFHERDVPQGDAARAVMHLGLTLQAAREVGLGAALSHGLDADIYPLQPLLATAALGRLPLQFSTGALVSGFWYLVLANSLFFVLWDTHRSARLALALGMPVLACLPALGTAQYGLITADVNVLAFLLSGSLLAWLLHSQHLTRTKSAAIAGAFFGLVLLARFWSGALVGLILAPLLAGSLLYTRDRAATLRGLAAFAVAAALTCGWYVVPRVPSFVDYWRTYIGWQRGSVGEAVQAWSRLLDACFSGSPPAVLATVVFSWVLGAELARRESLPSFLHRLHWPLLLAGGLPLVAMVAGGNRTWYLGFPVCAALGLGLVWPLERIAEAQALRSPAYRTLAVAAGLVLAALLLRGLRQLPNDAVDRQAVLRQIAQSLLDDRGRHAASRPRVSVGVALWGQVNPWNVANALLFGARQLVTYDQRPALASAATPSRPAFDVRSDLVDPRWAERGNAPDYAVVLLAQSGPGAADERTPRAAWIATGESLRRSPCYRLVAGPIALEADVLAVLARDPAIAACPDWVPTPG